MSKKSTTKASIRSIGGIKAVRRVSVDPENSQELRDFCVRLLKRFYASAARAKRRAKRKAFLCGGLPAGLSPRLTRLIRKFDMDYPIRNAESQGKGFHDPTTSRHGVPVYKRTYPKIRKSPKRYGQ